MNILLAEDQAMVRTALASLLRLEAGFNVTEAEDGAAALRLLKQQAGQVVSREMVLSAWQADESGDAGTGEQGGTHSNAVEVYVHRLRRKLGERSPAIRNIRGLGYMLDSAPQ